jgi:predicted nucleic acid-binding Zn ribbon protein
MPTYDYKCPVTGEVREEFHRMNEKPEIISKAGHKMEKIPSGGSIHGFDIYGRSKNGTYK